MPRQYGPAECRVSSIRQGSAEPGIRSAGPPEARRRDRRRHRAGSLTRRARFLAGRARFPAGRARFHPRRIRSWSRRPVPGPSLWQETLAGLAVVRADPLLRTPLLFGIVGAAYAIVPEAIAPAYAESVGGGPRTVGLIMASTAAGSVVGGLVMGRLVPPAWRVRLIRPLALAGTLPLALTALRPGLAASLALFALTGLASSYQIAANAMFGRRVPAEVRARAFGIAVTGMYGGQALAIVLAGAAAQFLAPHTVVALAGLLGALGVLLLPRPGSVPGPARGRHLRV